MFNNNMCDLSVQKALTVISFAWIGYNSILHHIILLQTANLRPQS